jgi:hypothetical protein
MTLTLLPTLRLVRSPVLWLSAAAFGGLVLLAAWWEHAHASPHGAARALDVFASLAAPLVAYGIVAAAAPDGLVRAGQPLTRLGAPPDRTAVATVFVAMIASALLCGVMGALAVAVGHGAEDPPVVRDVWMTLGLSALTGATYASYFMLGAALVAHAWGRGALLVIDWTLGSGYGVGAALLPRAHVRNVLGGEGPVDVLPSESIIALVLLTTVCVFLIVARVRRTRS